MAGQETHCIGSSDKPAWSKPSTFSLTRIDHVALNVVDAEASAKWYRERFGFTVLHAWTDPTILMIGKGNIRMGLFEKKGLKPVEQPARHKIIQHFAFSVDA